MKFCRSALPALGIVLAVVAMPASAGWKNFYVGTDVPDALTVVDDLPPPDLGDEPLAFEPPVLTNDQSGPVYEGSQTTQVPEPATISLLALALLGMGWSRRQSQQSAKA